MLEDVGEVVDEVVGVEEVDGDEEDFDRVLDGELIRQSAIETLLDDTIVNCGDTKTACPQRALTSCWSRTLRWW